MRIRKTFNCRMLFSICKLWQWMIVGGFFNWSLLIFPFDYNWVWVMEEGVETILIISGRCGILMTFPAFVIAVFCVQFFLDQRLVSWRSLISNLKSVFKDLGWPDWIFKNRKKKFYEFSWISLIFHGFGMKIWRSGIENWS